MFTKVVIVSLLLIAIVKSEGYYCPYTDLGANGDNDLLYDYYESNNGYWTRMGETGWQTLESYCEAKGDLGQHSDAGEWKCNDSFQMCTWNGSSCVANRSRRPDCKELCQAILDNKGPECLGDCPNGGSNDNMHMEYCGWSIPKYNEGIITTVETTLTKTEEMSSTTSTTSTTSTMSTMSTKSTTSTTVETKVEETSTSVRNRRCFVRRRR